jgi:hypothetical protein
MVDSCVHRQCRTYRGYELLVHHISNLKIKLIEEEVLELNAYFRDVSVFNHMEINTNISTASKGSWRSSGRRCSKPQACRD